MVLSLLKRSIVALLMLFLSVSIFAQSNKYNDSYNYNLGVEALRDNKYATALDYFEKEIEQHKDNATAHLLIARIHYRYDNYGDAISSIESALKYAGKKDKSTLASAYCLRGLVYSELGKDALAIKDFNQAIKLDPEDASFYEQRAQYYYSHGMYDLADRDYLKIQQLDPSSVMSYMGLGRNSIAQKEYEKAIEQFDYVELLYSNYSSAYAFRAEAYAGLKKWREFSDDVVAALSIDGNNKAFYLMQDKADTAYVFLTTKLKAKSILEPNQDYWPYCIGVVNEAAEKYETAIDFYQKAMKIDPSDMTANRISNCYQEIGDWNQAISYMEKAIAIDSTQTRYYLTKANWENEAGRVTDAIKDMDYYISKNPEDDWAFYRRGWFKDHSGDTEGAIEDYSTSLALDPDYAYAYMNRGVLYRNLGKADEAKVDFEMVLQLDTLAEDNSCRQYALFYLGKEAEAFDWMQQMIDKDGKGNYYDAACLYSLAGRGEESVEYLRKAFETGYRRFAHVQRDRDLDNIRELDSYKSLMDEYLSKQAEEILQDEMDYVERVVEIPFTRSGGVTKVKCSINDLPLSFIFDTGASTVSISSLEATFMYKNDYLTEKDIVGRSAFVDANGDISVGTVINLRKVTFGGLELSDVKASVVSNDQAPLLLGQTVLSRLGKIEIDYERNVLKITTKEKK